MMRVADLFVQVYVLVDDAIKAGAVPIPARPGQAPACSDAEVLTIAVVRHLLGRPSERAFLAEVRREWPTLLQDQAASWGMARWGSWSQPKASQMRAMSSLAGSRRAGSATLRLPWTHLGSIGFSQGALLGR